MKCSTSYFISINRIFFLWPLLWFVPHSALTWACHAPLAWFSCTTSLLTHRFGIASIWSILLLRWCLSPFFVYTTFKNGVESMGVARKPPLYYFLGCFPLGRWPLVFESWSRVYSNSSFLLSALKTTLSCLGLWMNFTSNNAKVSCHLSYFIKAFGWVSKYFK
jgi:hypothetical protein